MYDPTDLPTTAELNAELDPDTDRRAAPCPREHRGANICARLGRHSLDHDGYADNAAAYLDGYADQINGTRHTWPLGPNRTAYQAGWLSAQRRRIAVLDVPTEPRDCPNCHADSNSRAQCGRCLYGPHDGPCYHDNTAAIVAAATDDRGRYAGYLFTDHHDHPAEYPAHDREPMPGQPERCALCADFERLDASLR